MKKQLKEFLSEQLKSDEKPELYNLFVSFNFPMSKLMQYVCSESESIPK